MILLKNLRRIKTDDSAFSIFKNKKHRGIKVCAILPRYDGEHESVRLFYDSYKQAAEKLSLSERLVSRCANGLQEQTRGIRFEMVEVTDQMNAMLKYIERY